MSRQFRLWKWWPCPAVFGDCRFGNFSAQPHTRRFSCTLKRTKIPHPSSCTFPPPHVSVFFMHGSGASTLFMHRLGAPPTLQSQHSKERDASKDFSTQVHSCPCEVGFDHLSSSSLLIVEIRRQMSLTPLPDQAAFRNIPTHLAEDRMLPHKAVSHAPRKLQVTSILSRHYGAIGNPDL